MIEVQEVVALCSKFLLDLCGNPVRAVAHEGVRIFVFVSCTLTLKGGTYGYSNRPLGPAHGHRPIRADDTRHLRNAVSRGRKQRAIAAAAFASLAIGQPFRIGCLDAALRHIVQRQGVWTATGSEIIDWYRRNRSIER
jgi:hypothetical protein